MLVWGCESRVGYGERERRESIFWRKGSFMRASEEGRLSGSTSRQRARNPVNKGDNCSGCWT
jgi:hypothetical protein